MDVVIKHKDRRYWTLRASELYANAEPRIDWASLIQDGTGTKGQRSGLISATKDALQAMIDTPRRSAGTLSHATVLDWFDRFRRLVRWMVIQDLWQFSKLTPEDAAAYLRTIQPRRGGPPEVSLSTVQRHINTLRCLWDCRFNLRDSLRFNVNHIEQSLIQDMQLRKAAPWRPLGEAEAIRLLRTAKEWTEAHAEYVGGVLGRLWAEQEGLVGVSQWRARRRREMFYNALAREPQYGELIERLGMAGRPPYFVIKAAVIVLEGAALTSLLLLVGLRAREAVRLDVDCVMAPEVGDPEKLLLAGIAAKKGGRRRTWAITSAVKDAVDALRAMLAVPREISGQPSLLVEGAIGRCTLFASSKVPTRPEAQTVTVRMRNFARVAFPDEPDLVRRHHAHAARKTFARFVVLRDKRVLESLAYHFGHTHRAITDGYYVGADMELALLLDAENREDLARSLTDLLSSKNIAGKAGKAFVAHRELAVPRLRGKAAMRTVVERLISQGVQLAPCDWGYCVYSKALSACHGDAKGPNEAQRTAEVCSGCSNFLVTERHRAWWEDRVVRDEEFLSRSVPSQAVMVVQRRLAKSMDLLAELNEAKASNRALAVPENDK
jgi:integrase